MNEFEEFEPQIGEAELEHAQATLGEIVEQHRGEGVEGVEAGFRACNIEPTAANELIQKYYFGVRQFQPESFSAGVLHGLQLGALGASFITDSYIINVVTPDERMEQLQNALKAIRLEFDARGDNADPRRMRDYANEALESI